jgi:diguanylate cyclase (GGDEF)-like protein
MPNNAGARMKRFSLGTRIALSFLGFGLLLLISLGAYSYKTGSRTLVNDQVSKLTSLAIEKDATIEAYFEERSNDVQKISQDPELVQDASRLATARPGSSQAHDAHDALVRRLTAHMPGPNNSYIEMFVLSAASGKVLTSTDPRQEGKSKVGFPYFQRGKEALYLQPPYLSPDVGEEALTIGVPLSGRPLTVLAVRVRFSELQAVVQRRSGVQRTEDAFLINHDAVFVSQPRFLTEPVGPKRAVGTDPARRCAAGLDGSMIAKDYRGVPVLAVCRWNAARGLGLILKVDLTELYAPRVAFLKQTVIISAFALTAAMGSILLLAHTITAPLAALRNRVVRFSGSAAERPTLHSGENEVTELDAEFTRMVARVDVAKQQLAEANASLAQRVRYDELTGLPNRRMFVEALDREIARSLRNGERFAVLYLDLDHFKDVNDTLGHPVGDRLLKAVAERLRGCVRAEDMVARFGGDEFGLIVAGVSERDAENSPAMQAAAAAGGVADKIATIFGEPFQLEGHEVHSAASIGIAVFDADSPDAETLLSHADVALYRAKSEGRGTGRFFTDAMDAEVRARVDIDRELREAIAGEQFYLLYQPQVDLENGRLIGLEALVRWRHPSRGEVVPDEFIPAAERSGLIVPLGDYVLRQACRQTREWIDAGVTPPRVGVNLSGRQFKQPMELEANLAADLAEFNVPAILIELELTESVLMAASREHNDCLMRLHQAGHRISIDDFGTGYSSLDYLRRYPVDSVKIAQVFVADIGEDAGARAVVRAAISLAHELAIEVVVEGVETADQLKLVRGWGARIIQGYYFARPLPADEAAKLMRRGTIVPAAADLEAVGASDRQRRVS